ncbi:transporter [Ramlibacter sp. WS9]|uniref:transporter n=1 Tax=Ramlibacter sp. WS9 TaxID=1882741 RepID=UPI0011414CD3|nr:transporter [Ramlibacter sp. WS9]ROZ71310.1 transporter [Ramlibacter sp. WS9]
MRQAHKTFTNAILAATLAAGGTAHAATNPDPGDYTALPAGTDISLVYAVNARADQVYASGSKVPLPRNLGLDLDIGIFRHVHFMNWGGYRIDPQIVIPFGRQTVGLTGTKTSGIGDIIFGGTLWTIADLANGEHLGYTAFITAPTGKDKSMGFALSDNRWAVDLQVGYIRSLSAKWTVDLIGQAEFYQRERSTGAKRDPLVRGHAHLRYHLSESSHIAASLRQSMGGEEKLNGTTLAGRKNDTNLQLTWASFLTKQVQVQLHYAQDVKVENGPKVKALGLRALYAF